MTEQRTVLHFEGYSDDTFGEYNAIDDDVDNCASGDPITFRVSACGEAILIQGQYCPGEAGGWMIGVACDGKANGGEGPMPPWPMSLEQSGRPYSPRLVIEIPAPVSEVSMVAVRA